MQAHATDDSGSQPARPSETDVADLLGPLQDERQRIDRIVSRLEVTDDLVERADLASELVRSVSRYEDTLERAVFTRLEGVPSGETLDELNRDRYQLREDMTVIHDRTMGIDPRNVHASDGQGFEDTLEDVLARLQALLNDEDGAIVAIIDSLGSEARRSLAEDIAHTFQNASERPHPPHTSVGRFISNAHVKLDHVLEDVSTPSHPGSDTVNG
jgi:hypothetical protein